MRINKIPFFLWLTQSRDDLTLNLEEKFVESEELGKSSIKEVPIYLVALMKYLPFLMLVPYLYYPTYKSDIIPFFASFILVIFFIMVYLKSYIYILKTSIVFVCIINFVFLFKIEDYAILLDTSITFFAEILLFSILAFDIFYFKGYKNWYFLESFKNEICIKFSQKRERKFLFFLKPKTGFNVFKKVYLRGYFLRIENEDIK